MEYTLDEFLDACGEPGKVAVAYDAKKDAEKYFKLVTEKDLLAFIFARGLEKLTPINCEEWRFNPNKPPAIYVDAYSFYSGNKFGYIAFMFIPKTNKWNIKSFHLNNNVAPINIGPVLQFSPFANLTNLMDIIREDK